MRPANEVWIEANQLAQDTVSFMCERTNNVGLVVLAMGMMVRSMPEPGRAMILEFITGGDNEPVET